MLDGRVRLLVITHVPTSGGLVNPAAEVGKLAREHGILSLLGPCQSAGQLPVNVEDLDCDMLLATGHTYLRTPRGTGFLSVRRTVLDLPDMRAAIWAAPARYEIHAGMQRFECFECNSAARIGLASALRTRLSSIPGMLAHDRSVTRCGQRAC